MSMWKSEYTNSWLHNLGLDITHTHKYLITRCKPWNRGATLNKFILLKTMSFLEFLCYISCLYAYFNSIFDDSKNIPLIRAIVTRFTFRQCFCDERQIKIPYQVIENILKYQSLTARYAIGYFTYLSFGNPWTFHNDF